MTDTAAAAANATDTSQNHNDDIVVGSETLEAPAFVLLFSVDKLLVFHYRVVLNLRI